MVLLVLLRASSYNSFFLRSNTKNYTKYHEEGTKENKEMEFDLLSNKIIGCAIEVHKILGPGLLESAYEECLCYEFDQNGIFY